MKTASSARSASRYGNFANRARARDASFAELGFGRAAQVGARAAYRASRAALSAAIDKAARGSCSAISRARALCASSRALHLLIAPHSAADARIPGASARLRGGSPRRVLSAPPPDSAYRRYFHRSAGGTGKHTVFSQYERS